MNKIGLNSPITHRVKVIPSVSTGAKSEVADLCVSNSLGFGQSSSTFLKAIFFNSMLKI